MKTITADPAARMFLVAPNGTCTQVSLLLTADRMRAWYNTRLVLAAIV